MDTPEPDQAASEDAEAASVVESDAEPDFESDFESDSDDETASADAPRSVAATVKSLFKRNKRIIVGGTALAVATGVLISLAKGQDVAESAGEFEAFPDLAVLDPKRRSPYLHQVAEHQRKTKNGQTTVRSHVRGGPAA